MQGQARNDAFTGGIRFTADTVMDLERARSRYAQAVRLTMNGNADAAALRRVLEPHVSKDDPAANVVDAPAPRGGGAMAVVARRRRCRTGLRCRSTTATRGRRVKCASATHGA